jgi:hypothetical protein
MVVKTKAMKLAEIVFKEEDVCLAIIPQRDFSCGRELFPIHAIYRAWEDYKPTQSILFNVHFLFYLIITD